MLQFPPTNINVFDANDKFTLEFECNLSLLVKGIRGCLRLFLISSTHWHWFSSAGTSVIQKHMAGLGKAWVQTLLDFSSTSCEPWDSFLWENCYFEHLSHAPFKTEKMTSHHVQKKKRLFSSDTCPPNRALEVRTMKKPTNEKYLWVIIVQVSRPSNHFLGWGTICSEHHQSLTT